MEGKKIGNLNSRKTGKLIFYICLLAFPIAQFIIFYICVNFNSILLSFKQYDVGKYSFIGFGNYAEVFKMIFTDQLFGFSLKNSVYVILINFLVILPLSLVFSFYIAKKFFGYKLFRVMLFLPTIVSSIVLVILYTNLLDKGIVEILHKIGGYDDVTSIVKNAPPERQWIAVLFYYVWTSFGTNTLLYSGGMSGVSNDIIEAANLDGAVGLREFWHVSLPGVFPTIVVLTLANLTGFFTNKLALFSFYGNSASERISTVGYYFFKKTYGGVISNPTEFPILAAMGLVFTLILAPITFLTKYLMEKFGPSEE